MTDSRPSVQRALDRVNAARPFERPSRLRELVPLGIQLSKETEAKHQWLIRADQWLEEHKEHPEFIEREERYLKEIVRYQESHNLLGKALMVIGAEGKS